MPIEREIPESHITSLADQFCETAKLLYDETAKLLDGTIPKGGPQAMRVNAVFAVELYIKSLDCHWVRHNELQTTGSDCNLIPVEPNKIGHKLDQLFDHLEDRAKQYLIDHFSSHRLNQNYPGLRPILVEYSDKFATDRYIFESRIDDVSHPVSETVELALFFQTAVNAIETVRLG